MGTTPLREPHRPDEGWWQMLLGGIGFLVLNHLSATFGNGVHAEALGGGVTCLTISGRLWIGSQAFQRIERWAGNGWRLWLMLGTLFAAIVGVSEAIALTVYGQHLLN